MELAVDLLRLLPVVGHVAHDHGAALRLLPQLRAGGLGVLGKVLEEGSLSVEEHLLLAGADGLQVLELRVCSSRQNELLRREGRTVSRRGRLVLTARLIRHSCSWRHCCR